jgi:hypothetical protein
LRSWSPNDFGCRYRHANVLVDTGLPRLDE